MRHNKTENMAAPEYFSGGDLEKMARGGCRRCGRVRCITTTPARLSSWKTRVVWFFLCQTLLPHRLQEQKDFQPEASNQLTLIHR